MKVPVTVERTAAGRFLGRCALAPYQDVRVEAGSRAELLEKLRAEITYRMEWCPCSTVPDGALELEVVG